ncbi:MAG: tetratricopeptide repeat protein [Thermaurantimonas sp.]|uniref:tetratricopeptide repeat protein n=1 Tax=Thermaurantimonas sp. TaxID=2681568 RepID=UPI0039193C74
MNKWTPLVLAAFLLLSQTSAQELLLPASTSEKVDCEKLLVEYRELYKRSPQRMYYVKMYDCLLELKDYKEAVNLAEAHIRRTNEPEGVYLVDVAFAKARMGDRKTEEKILNRVLESINKNPQFAYQIGQALSDKGYFEAALRLYEIAEKINPSFNFSYQKALLYADLGQLEKMYDTYIEILERSPSMAYTVKNLFNRIMAPDGGEDNFDYITQKLRTKALSQKNPVMTDVLTYIYNATNDFASAFEFLKEWHEKSDYGAIGEIYEIASQALKNQQYDLAISGFDWVIAHSSNANYSMRANLSRQLALTLKALNTPTNPETVIAVVTDSEKLIQIQGINFNTLPLAEATARLMAFKANQKDKALDLIESLVKLPGQNPNEKALLLITKGDIYLSMKEFMLAIVAYARAEEVADNELIKDDAKFARAKAIYYSGDVPWALEIFEILQESTSKPISNDATAYASKILLNSGGDTTYEAMTYYAHADMFYYVGEYQKAHKILDYVIQTYTNHPIQDDAYLLKAKTFEAQGLYQQAVQWYEKVYTVFGYELLADQAIYQAAVLYEEKLNEPSKAKELYELIVMQFIDSFLHNQARLRLRALLNKQSS